MVQGCVVWYNMVQCGTIRVRCGTMMCCLVQHGAVWYSKGEVWNKDVLFGTAWCNVVQ